MNDNEIFNLKTDLRKTINIMSQSLEAIEQLEAQRNTAQRKLRQTTQNW